MKETIETMFKGVKPKIAELDEVKLYTQGSCWIYAGAMNFIHGLEIWTVTGHVFNLFHDKPIDIQGYHDLEVFFHSWSFRDLNEVDPVEFENWWSAATDNRWRHEQIAPLKEVLPDALFRAQQINLEGLI